MSQGTQVCDHRWMIEPYLAQWGLVPDGAPITTHTGILLPVLQGSTPAILKVATVEEERAGAEVMVWWAGEGAACVLAHDRGALLMERLDGPESLVTMARSGRDDEASQILCAVAGRLHAPRPHPPPSVVPLSRWFRSLEFAASAHGGVFVKAAETAHHLLATPREVTTLHGDLHHANVLDGGRRGWLAIDPKGLLGERGFDFANLSCNPDLEIATTPGRLSRQTDVVALAAGLDRTRLLQWVVAYAGLSAAWTLADGDQPTIALAVAALAEAELKAP